LSYAWNEAASAPGPSNAENASFMISKFSFAAKMGLSFLKISWIYFNLRVRSKHKRGEQLHNSLLFVISTFKSYPKSASLS